MPKTFISFLGAISYKDTRYYHMPDKSDLGIKTAYVQEAIIRLGLADFKEDDRIYIFTTEDAFKNNYENRILNFDKEKNEPKIEKGKGLQSRLELLKESGKIMHFDKAIIPNGHTESEMLQVFQEVIQRIREGDDIYFDITYGFRSLPMLGIVLMNYAKTVLQANVKAIYYGNYEAGRAEHEKNLQIAKNRRISEAELTKIKEKIIEAPILNLLSLSELQEWTIAANNFLQLGKMEDLAKLVQEDNPELGEKLLEFEQSITTCRGKRITQENDILDIKKELQEAVNDSIKEQLAPLISKIKAKIAPFEDKNTLINGFAAVEWCIQHGMIQQGITFLQETIVSHIIEISGYQQINTYLYRFIAGGALNGYRKPPNNFDYKNYKITKEEVCSIYDEMNKNVRKYQGLIALFKELTGEDGFRNDINHCGFRETASSPEALKESLENLFTNIKALNL